MNSNRKLVRWGALAVLVTLMSGCCVVPWGGRYYGGGHGDQRGGYDHGGWGDQQRGDRDGDRWHH